MLNLSDEVKTLLIAGFFGSLVRLLTSTPKSWKQWIARVLVGVICAVFLGEILGNVVAEWTGAKSASLSASGFVIGSAAEQVIANIQRRFSK